MEIKEVSLYYDYYETIIHKNQFEKTFQNGGYIKVPFINNRGLTEPNIIISDENSSTKYRSENIYITHNVHKIPFYLNKSKYDVLPILNEEDDTVFSNGELIIEHIPITNTDKKIYTVFLLKTMSDSSFCSKKNKDNENIIDKLIKYSFNTNDINFPTNSYGRSPENSFSSALPSDEKMNTLAEPLCFSLNDLLSSRRSVDENKNSGERPKEIIGKLKCLTNNDNTVFIFKTPIICTSLQEISRVNRNAMNENSQFSDVIRTTYNSLPINRFGVSQDYFLFPVYNKNEYKNYKVIIQTPQTHVLLTVLAEAVPKPKLNFSECNVEKFSFNSFGFDTASAKTVNFPTNSIGNSPENSFSSTLRTGESPYIETYTGIVYDDAAGSNADRVNVTDLKLTDNLQLVCSHNGVQQTDNMDNTVDKFNYLLFISSFFFMIFFFCCAVWSFQNDIMFNLYMVYFDIPALNGKEVCFIIINLLILLPSITLLLSWMTELFIIGLFWLVGSVGIMCASYISFYNKNIEDLKKNDPTLEDFITVYTRDIINITPIFIFTFIRYASILIMIAFSWMFCSFSLFTIDYPTNSYFLNTQRYVHDKYPGKTWHDLPRCNDTEGSDPSIPVTCTDFYRKRMSSNNRELFGVFFSVPILLYLFLYRPILYNLYKHIKNMYISYILSVLIVAGLSIAYYVPIYIFAISKDPRRSPP
jgi:hypothetical protein